MNSEKIEAKSQPPSQLHCAASGANKLYLYFWHSYSPVMYTLYEIEVPKLPPPPTKASQVTKTSKLSPILQLKTGEYPVSMCCVSLGSKLYFFGGEFNIDDPYIDEDVKKKLKNVERDVFPREVYILDLGASGDSSLDKLLECGTPMNSGKASPEAFVADGKIYVVGSTIKMMKDLDLKNFAYFEVYDPVDDKWTKLPNPPIRNVNTTWVGHTIVGRRAVLVAWQGWERKHLYFFDLDTYQWTKYASIPHYPGHFSGQTEFVENTLYGCYHDSIAALAPLVDEEEIEEEEEGAKEEEEAKKVHHTRILFSPARLLKNHRLHFLSEEMHKDAFVNLPPQLKSSSTLLHLGNRHFCYVRTGMPPHPVYGGAVQDDNVRYFRIAIFHAPGQTYEKDGIRHFQAELLHSAHYVVNTLFPSYGYICGCFSPGLNSSWYQSMTDSTTIPAVASSISASANHNVPYNQANYNQSNSKGRGRGNNNRGGGHGGKGNTQYSHPQASTQYNQFSQNQPPRSERPVCQICGKTGHLAINCYHRMDFAYQGKHPPTKLAAMVTASNAAITQDQPWLADCAATDHVTASLNNLSFPKPYKD